MSMKIKLLKGVEKERESNKRKKQQQNIGILFVLTKEKQNIYKNATKTYIYSVKLRV